jgi:acyl-CoA thioesterase
VGGVVGGSQDAARRRPAVLSATFDSDTALHPLGDGRLSGHVPVSWFVGKGPNGGFFAALAARALATVVEAPPRSLTLHYLAPPKEGPIEVRPTVLRQGRTTLFVRLEFEQDGERVCEALAACAPWLEGHPEWDDAPRPDVPPPLECEPLPFVDGMPVFLRNYEIRWLGWDTARRPAWLGGWMRTAQERRSDAPLLAAMTDALMPPAFLRLEQRPVVPTIDLTIHFRAPLPAGAHPWVLGIFTSAISAGGVCTEDGQLWSEDGRLLAESRQLAIVR